MFASEWILGAFRAEEVLRIRRGVLINELSWPEEYAFDDHDEYAAHLLIRVDNVPAACARLYGLEGGAVFVDHVCVLPPYRKQRYGDLCFRICLEKAAQMLAPRIETRTPKQYMPYFEAFGFTSLKEENAMQHIAACPAEIQWHAACKTEPAADQI